MKTELEMLRDHITEMEKKSKADKERIQELERALEASQNVLLSIHSGYSLKMTNAETTEVRTVMALNFKTLNPL